MNTTSTGTITTPRAIQKSFLAHEQNEGVGARVRRSIGTPKLRNFSPFLMLDHFNSPDGTGKFPDHPHRGQETISYMLEGAMDHEDFTGSKGRINAGDLQFMTAGRGIMHAEMPVSGQKIQGMQLWVDLPKELKYTEPRYRDLRASEIPIATSDDKLTTVKVISGNSLGVESLKDLAYTPVWFLDVTIQPGGSLSQTLPLGWNAFAYTLGGVTTFSNGDSSSETVVPYHNVVFAQQGDGVNASVEEGAEEAGRFILVAGIPLDQPVVQYGPFVTNSREEVMQALQDFQGSKNGFERGLNWESEIAKGHM